MLAVCCWVSSDLESDIQKRSVFCSKSKQTIKQTWSADFLVVNLTQIFHCGCLRGENLFNQQNIRNKMSFIHLIILMVY